MKTGARLGLAVTAGYVLGRFHKMRWALTLAALAGRGQLPGGKGGLLQQGAKLLSSSPEFAKLTEEMRGQLVEAGKAAAVAAVSNRINSLSDELRDRSDAMRVPAAGDGGSPVASEEEETDVGRVPEQRRAASGGESEPVRGSGKSRTKEESRTRAGHPSGHSGAKARNGAGARQGRDSGQARPRASASRTGGDRE